MATTVDRRQAIQTHLKKVNEGFVLYFKTSLKSEYYTKAARINSGFCREWAYIVHKLHGFELWFNDTFEHAFVKHGNLFYDAGTTNGVLDWIDLEGLKDQRLGLVNLRQHGIDKSHPMSVMKFEKLRGFKVAHVNAIMNTMKQRGDET